MAYLAVSWFDKDGVLISTETSDPVDVTGLVQLEHATGPAPVGAQSMRLTLHHDDPPILVTHASLRSMLDVGMLTAGTAEIAEVVAQKIAAAAGAFLRLDVGQLTVTGQTQLADLVAERIAADVGEYLQLSVGQLVAGEAVMDEATIQRLFADVVVASMSMAEAFIGSNAILDDSVTAPKIVASEELWAKIAQFVTVRAENMAADFYTGGTYTGATFQSSEAHPKTYMNASGVGVTDEDGQDSVHLGRQYSVRNSDGETLAGIDEMGAGTFQDLSSANDPVINGTPLIGTLASIEAPSSLVQSWFDRMPRGVVAHGRFTGLQGRRATNGEAALIELSTVMYPDRMYEITLEDIPVVVSGGTWANLNLRYNWNGQPTLSSSVLKQWPITTWGMSENTLLFGGTTMYSPGSAATVHLLLSIQSAGGARIGGSNTSAEILVKDIGPVVGNTALLRHDNTSAGNVVAPPPPSTKKSYSKTFWATGAVSWWSNNSVRSDKRQYAYQGNVPGQQGIRSAIIFPDMTPDLSGAEITEMIARFRFVHWYQGSGGRAQIQFHNSRSTSSVADMEHGFTGPHMARGATATVKIPSRYWDRFKSGNLRGFGFGDTSPSQNEYGYATWASCYIEVKYVR